MANLSEQGPNPSVHEQAVVWAALPMDGVFTSRILNQAGILCKVIANLESLELSIEERVSTVIVAAEILTFDNMARLKSSFASYRPWSGLAVIIMAGADASQPGSTWIREIYESFHQVIFLARPVAIDTFVGIVKGTLLEQRRYYDVRALLERNEKELTWRRSVEASLRLAHAELDAARQAAEAANRAKSAFLANLSHEIRTPICAMVGFSELLNDVNLGAAERHSYCNIIARNGAQLVTLIDDILDLSKIEAGFLQIERVNTSLVSLLSDVKNALAIKAMHKGITLTLEVNEGMPELILTDPTRLRQILLNVIGNSIKFTNDGGVKVVASYRWPSDKEPGELKFVVEDTGCGISEEGKAKLFMPFSQADATTTRKFGGTGLGLALSKRLARSLGGDVNLAWSEPEQGSRFIVTIVAPPVTSTSPQVTASGPLVRWPDASQNLQPLTGLHILLAEDAVDSQVLITQFLKIAGGMVDVVNDGAEAVNKAMSDGYDVVLMDVQMPILDGYGATRLLRSRGYVGPIIALTAHAMLGEKEKSLQAGCDYHLVKPIDRVHLVNTVALFSGRKII